MQSAHDIEIEYKNLAHFYQQRFGMNPGQRVANIDEAVEFVKNHGIVSFWPIPDLPIASLWKSVAGDRPVADEHDDLGHITWAWKDTLIGKTAWYYSKLFCRRNFMVRFDLSPYLYALSANFGDYREDHLIRYEEGSLSFEARNIYDAILNNGPLDTLQLRKASHLVGKSSDSVFNKAIVDLQMDMKILPIAISQSGAWHYSFVYEIVARHYPHIPEEAREITVRQAMEKLLITYIKSCGICRIANIQKLFRWPIKNISPSLNTLINNQIIQDRIIVLDQKGTDWVALPEVVLQLTKQTFT